MQDQYLTQSTETFLKSIDEFMPTEKDFAEITAVTFFLWVFAAVLFFVLGLGGAFGNISLHEEHVITVLILVTTLPTGYWITKHAKTSEEWQSGFYISTFVATFNLALLAAGWGKTLAR